jgi:peptide/nickel transport system substrate-binding protein
MREIALKSTALLGVAALIIAACTSDEDRRGCGGDEAAEGEPFPAIDLLTVTEDRRPEMHQASVMVADALRDLGFEINFIPMEFNAQLVRLLDEQDFDIAFAGYTARPERLDPTYFMGALHSGFADAGERNAGGYSNADYDTLFEEQQRTVDVEERRELVLRMQQIVADERPIEPLFHRDDTIAYNSDRWSNLTEMPGEAVYNEWVHYDAKPLTDDRFYTIGVAGDVDTINPLAAATGEAWKLLRLIYDKLVRITPENEIEPWAASSIETINNTTLDVTIREGMVFHDGTPATATDVQFTFDYFTQTQSPYFLSSLEPIESTEVVGSNVVRFHLREPFASFVGVTLSQIPILPKHIWEDVSSPIELPLDQVPTTGSGPFRFDSYDRGEYIRIVTNDDHWTAEDIDIDGIDYIIHADAEGVFTGLLTGEIDAHVDGLQPAHIAEASDASNLSLVNTPNFGYVYMEYNSRREPFDNPAFRQALAHAIDRETMVEVLMDGRGEPASSPIAPSNVAWHNSSIEIPEFDPERACALLREAGYGRDSEGRVVVYS